MSISAKDINRELKKQNRKCSVLLQEVPVKYWPEREQNHDRIAVWRSRDYLVQAYDESCGIIRLSINRTEVRPDRQWKDGLSWDELQEIKRQCGYGEAYALEVYPRDQDVVNVANMRHLWIMPEPLPIGWFAEGYKGECDAS